jgi:hypothetical protein
LALAADVKVYVARDEQGKPYTVRYEAVNAMLLNEFLKEHHKVRELEANAASSKSRLKPLPLACKRRAHSLQ